MKLSKQQEKRMMQVYNAYLDNYLKGDVEAIHPLLDNNYTQVGSAESEVFNNKKDAVQFLYDTIDQVSGKLEMRNRVLNMEQHDHTILIQEVCDLYALADKEWIFYSKFRVSTLMQEKKDGWKLVHQHSSFPDSRTEEGQNIAIDKITEENIQLREAVKRRTIELEQKNKDLLIEVALEKVRSRTMAMHKSDELAQTTEVLHQQLIEVGIKADRTSIAFPDERDGAEFWSTHQGGTRIDHKFKVDKIEPHQGAKTFAGWKKKLKSIVVQLEGEELNALLNYYKEKIGLSFSAQSPHSTKRYYTSAYFSHGWITLATAEPLSSEKINILERFAAVFNLTYTRFFDLQKAEAQAREAKIETSLEKVRSRSMAMHYSSDLPEVLKVVAEQLAGLGLKFDQASFAKVNQDGSWEIWLSTPEKSYPAQIHVPYLDHVIFNSVNGIVADGADFHTDIYSYEEKNRFFNHIFQNTIAQNIPEARKQYVLNSKGLARSLILTKNIWLSLGNYEAIPYTDEENSLLKRFATVFEQSYTRFLDLQRAEAQTKEAKIEVSLERVRSKAMSMHSSQDLADTISMFYHELELFSITPRRCGVGLLDRETQIAELSTMNTTEQGNSIEIIGKLKMADHPVLQGVFDNWILQKEFHPVLRGNEVKDYYQLVRPQIEFPDYPNDEEQFGYFFFFPEGGVYAWTDKELGENELKIYRRFTTVLSLTYKRYKDIKEAETQTREAQIELGLERVRARAMAMQNSEELKELISTVFAELTKLDLVLTRCLIMIYDPKTNGSTWWMANSEAPANSIGLFVQYHEQPPYLAYLKAWQQRNIKWQYILKGPVKKQWDDYLFTETELSHLPDFVIAGMKAPDSVYLNASFNNFGNLTLASLEPLSDEHFDILLRFAKVFNLTYTRFNDLKQAESQAREAIIEAALERVRSKTMAMHNSEDVGDTALVLFDELEKLGVATNRCGILVFDDKGFMEVWTAGLGANYAVRGRLDTRIHRMLTQCYKGWKKKDAAFSYLLQGSDLIDYYTVLKNAPEYPYQVPDALPAAQTISLFYFPEGALYAFTADALSNEAVQVFSRFAGVFALTYRRYLDLIIAEQQTRQAVKQSSLDRVRAEIASMRTTSDLERITPLIWNELTTLGVPFIRCGVFIMDENSEQIHTFLSTPNGKAIAAFKLPFDSPGTSAQTLAHWRKKEIFTDHWDEAAFKKWTANLMELGVISSAEKYAPQQSPANLHLYFLPFLQGMLYVGSEVPLGSEEMSLVQTLANAFSTAYSRFEDFNKLESAKQQIEKTLVDLKLAQSQLIQSVKMASLGELTAGIAHEIQNPLNFVNNFSEVSIELIEEVKSEKLKALSERDSELENELLDNISQNLQKISHHGKRADFIVKGMLQHSRASTGEKQLTNINTLADEFLKLSYHGLRAKDKSFNAELVTNFDQSLPKIDVVQQDIGRVLLNLFNNAFYAVGEKNKEQRLKNKDTTFKPRVEVFTKLNKSPSGERGIIISVKDNGNGIPEGIKDKIMQPFFTTKPTGEGTGLGLSLSYDIIKAHGGEIKVETKEGEGSEFIIELPKNTL